MSGIYIHIPFCKQACHYCDFHFSTSMKRKDDMVRALVRELEMRSAEAEAESVETIYFGGGTPSVLSDSEISHLIDTVYQNYSVANNPEITLEANPDDLSAERIASLADTAVNRLSIGVQSFFEEDLKLMNRAHNAVEAANCIRTAREYFENISVDLIYGIPGLDERKWMHNIQIVVDYGIPHISSYALTVEPRTALKKLIQTGKIAQPNDDEAQRHFEILTQLLQANGYSHYELSNFGKEGYFSKNNTSYWLGKKYIGIGPSAHSYNSVSRSWNISNNAVYLREIMAGKFPSEIEELTLNDRYNEYIMTGLRTMWGVSMDRVKKEFGQKYYDHLNRRAERFLDEGVLRLYNATIITTVKGKFLADGIASDLFLVNLE